ncbi:hypothetical protein Pse7367_3759 (plasmid) [Thalassoporum mexicanum PCC 7367]|uniref:hypothetical protein n=1 Tax=Thalassoporum mexicanum TaxID=3457544 RepID=UPI00029FBC1A|nr:hypothetical protein [Pseudanabaena sp. PCC 7367]AFY71985.1 hypothetical protein Pse7367_3759 [Pseudanabaena sp. PCC 7367]
MADAPQSNDIEAKLKKVDELATSFYNALVAEGATDLVKTKIVAILLAAESIIDRKRSFFEQKLIDEVWADITGAELDEVYVERNQPRTTDAALGSPESASKLTDNASDLLSKLVDKGS